MNLEEYVSSESIATEKAKTSALRTVLRAILRIPKITRVSNSSVEASVGFFFL